MTTKRKPTSESPGTPPGLRAIAYLRVSTRGQAERGMGLEVQRDRVRTYAAAQGYELVDVVQEAASGAVHEGDVLSYERRKVLAELLNRAEDGAREDGRNAAYDVLLVASFDRLSRDYASLIFVKRLLRRYGVQAVSATEENGNGGEFAEAIAGVLAVLHDFERGRILARVRAGKAAKREKGKHVHGRIPFGYRSAGSGELAVDESESAIVRRIFEDARNGDSPGRIARALKAEQAGSRAWNRGTVRGILENPIYAGERYGVRRAQPAIVSRQLWNAANRALRARARKAE
jgi:site-specific DNA recombinase